MTAEQAIALLVSLLAQAARLGALIQKARAEGRDVSEAELQALIGDDDEARARLQAAIERARST